jgi:hypothetical protein
LSMSASAPAGKVNRKKGREAAVERSERYNGDGVIVFITQVAAMSCAATQHPETRLASQSLEKTGFRRANQMEVEFVLIDWVAIEYQHRAGSQNSGVAGVHSLFELRMPASLAKLSSQDSSTKNGSLPYSAAPELLQLLNSDY